jgi:hypothetical protein
VTVVDQDEGRIDRYAGSGTTATLKGTVSLSGRYPSGGSPVATLSGVSDPGGVVALQAR